MSKLRGAKGDESPSAAEAMAAAQADTVDNDEETAAAGHADTVATPGAGVDVSADTLATPGAGVDVSADTMATPGVGVELGDAKTMATPGGGAFGPKAAEKTKNSGKDSLVGMVLAERYEITTKIGQGGMGAVYEAKHTGLGRQMAVKVLLDKYAEHEQVVARLEQEARLASSIGHEHIVDITDFGQTRDGRTFVVMEYLEGESLGELLSRLGPLDEERVVRISKQVASALGAAHKKGVVHRDVKPENVFITRRKNADFAKVVDFGISKSIGDDDDSPRLTQTGMVLGTPLYMSPEQARGDEALDHRIDIYALGVIMYELSTGRVPHQGSNYLNILAQVLSEEPPLPKELRPDLSEEFESVILRAMARDRDDRYQTMEELEDDLAVLASGSGASLTAAALRITASRLRKRRAGSKLRAVWAVAGIAVIAAAAAITASVVLSEDEAAPAKAPAQSAALAIDASLQADAAPKTVEEITISVTTDPAGATVYADGGSRKLGIAPLSFQTKLEDRGIQLVAELEGYERSQVTINPWFKDQRATEIRLTPNKKVKPLRRTPPTPPVRNKPEKKPDDTAGGELSGNPYDR